MTTQFEVAEFEDRSFFALALRHGVQQGTIDHDKLAAIEVEAPKGIVQIATAFGSPYLRAEIELARDRIVNLASLYLSETAGNDLTSAAKLIRDNTFLSLSRGGSSLLKGLFALPEYPILGSHEHGRVEDFLEFWSRKKSSLDYRNAKKQRELNQREIKLALKLARQLSLPTITFQDQHCEADALIRTAVLMSMQKLGKKDEVQLQCMNHIEFAGILNAMRKKGYLKSANLGLTLKLTLTDEEQQLVELLQQDMLKHDLPSIIDKQLPLDQLINALKTRYFIRGHDIEDSVSYEALVSKEWSRHTKGKSDTDSILTLLLCIAAQVPVKVSLTEAAAKTLIKKIRKQGLQTALAIEFVQQHAPHEKQAGLLEDWTDFFEQAQLYLLDDWDNSLIRATNFLRENCNIEKLKKV